MGELLTDRVAVVTGAASGIGRAIARQFAERGADAVCADVREQPRTADRPTHESIREGPDCEARFVQCDVSDYDDVASEYECCGCPDSPIDCVYCYYPDCDYEQL